MHEAALKQLLALEVGHHRSSLVAVTEDYFVKLLGLRLAVDEHF